MKFGHGSMIFFLIKKRLAPVSGRYSRPRKEKVV
jgi:hypothetical protein